MRSAGLFTLILSVLLAAVPCAAQTVDSTEDAFALSQGGDVPPFVVPVLRLVSKTHVEPTTGIVLSGSGLVMVPAGFASAGDEIVVLDGGTDIVRNGRTARVEKNFPMDGIQILSVYGLRRAGAPFADDELVDGAAVRLVAFPPAEQIAEGAAPLDIPTTVTVFGESGTPAVSGVTPLPNVTGPLLDECGNVTAFSMAHDIQTMETTPGTRYQWRATLIGIMETMGIRPGPTACIDDPVPTEPELQEETPPLPEEETPPEPEPEPEPEAQPEDESVDTQPEPSAPEAPQEEQPEILPPIELDQDPVDEASEVQEPEAPEEASGGWMWLLLAALMVAGGIGLHFWRRKLSAQSEQQIEEPISAPPPEEDLPAAGEPVMDSLLVLSGKLGSDQPIEVSCPVSSHAVNVIIGRGQADLRISSAAISRQHAALNGAADALTITDLGSNNGTLINGVPCLEGEIMFLEPGDTVTLGDARFTVELKPVDEE
jgi:hypothetical protein